ncbi:Hsp70 family protein [Nocardia puris]|uniref:Hsp70 family protein n=1 Tax=Nocardia puris TaxID=208602 RepID=UPI0018956DA6|nr:Hsp70 family protein [Nocardia puris]MBF6212087.1 Hsp70 family protein [Nocardia puris]MBF6461910.1 Hsp70 family protein [Nocardia puris]
MRTRRTALTFDDAGGARLSRISQYDTATTEFADLARDPEAMIVGGRLFSPANLVAAVVNGLLEGAEPDSGAVATYPAVYTDKQLALLRQALDLGGARHVLLVPEPVAAAEWLDWEHGPLETGFVLVYDLGGESLDVSVVRVGPDWEDHPIVGKPVRSYDFGGRSLGDMIARYGGRSAPGAALPMTAMVDVDGLRADHVRDSFDLVRDCVRSTGLAMSDISRVLLVGGASRPAEVARTLGELGRPVVVSADPGQITAVGAARFALRAFAPAGDGDRPAPRVAVFSSAAVASALAMSAATVFGGSGDSGLLPVLDRFPVALPLPPNALLYEPNGDTVVDRAVRNGLPASLVQNATFAMSGVSAVSRAMSSVGQTMTYGPALTRSGVLGDHRSGSPGDHRTGGTGTQYADPAHFRNPLPFQRDRPVSSPGWERPGVPGISLPSLPNPNNPAPQPNPGPVDPIGEVPGSGVPGVGTPGSGLPGTGAPGTGAPGTGAPGTGAPGTGETPGAGTPSNGAPGTNPSDGSPTGGSGGTSGGSTGTGGAAGGGASTGGGTGGGASSGGGSDSAGGGTSSGGASSGGAGSGGSGGSGGDSSGGGASGGGASGGGASGGGASGGGASGGGASGGASGGGKSGGGASSGGSGGGNSSGGGASSSGGGGNSSSGGNSSGSNSSSRGGGGSGGSQSSGGSGGSRSGGGSDSSGGSSSSGGGSKSGGGSGGSGGGGNGGGGGGGGARGGGR